jgi:DNA repair protein RecN (Recombination protein N)
MKVEQNGNTNILTSVDRFLRTVLGSGSDGPMLRHLRIRDFALLEDLSLDLEPGLNLFTGETGAGKSIVVDALTFLAGRRAEVSFVREGAERAVLEAIVEPVDPASLDRRLDEWGLEPTAEGVLTLRREIRQGGGGRAFVNGSPTPVQQLRKVASAFLEVHAQHEAQRMFDTVWHRRWLDLFGKHATEVAAVKETAENVFSAEKALLEFQEQARDARTRREELSETIAEIGGADLQPGERESLDRERRRLRHAHEFAEGIDRTLEALDDNGSAALSRLLDAERALAGLIPIDDRFTASRERVESARLDLEDLRDTLQSQRASFAFDPERLETIESRRALLDDLCLRYGPAEQDVLERRDEAVRMLQQLEHGEEHLVELRNTLESCVERYRKAAARLRKARRRTVPKVKQAVESELAELAMGGAQFSVCLEPSVRARRIEVLPAAPEIHPHGTETVRFELAANPGEPERPLEKVASGGELSRIMLALHLALGEGQPHSIVFDEIDVGIGGSAADGLGARMHRLAGVHQVIVVTHQPQVAAHADHHYHVSKEVRDGRTRTTAGRLEGSARHNELARMLGGEHITDASRRNAEALVEAVGAARGKE